MRLISSTLIALSTLSTSFALGQHTVTVTSEMPVPLTSARSIVVQYLNPFRYDYNASATTTAIAAPTPPSQLAPTTSVANAVIPSAAAAQSSLKAAQNTFEANAVSLSESQKALIAQKTSPQQVGKTPPPPPPSLTDCDPSSSTSIWTTSQLNQSDRITLCFTKIQSDAQVQSQAAMMLRNNTNAVIRNASAEQACYVEKVKYFSQPLLLRERATELLRFAIDSNTERDPSTSGNGCRLQNSTTWDFTTANTIQSALTVVQFGLNSLSTAQGYAIWLGAPGSVVNAAESNLATSLANLLIDVTSYGMGTAGQGTNPSITETQTAFLSTVASNRQWRDRLGGIVGGSSDPNNVDNDPPFKTTLGINPCREWYGKGRTDKLALKIADISSSGATVPDLQVATNTCNPFSIVSTGIGISFLSNPTYAFVPNSSGTQVIGKTVSNTATPLYGVFYDILLKPLGKSSGAELFASPGVGLTSASSTTTSDYLGGISLGLARRLVFITAAVDFGQRTSLQSGFALGMPMGALTSVPTQTTMKAGAMISISFGIAPSQ